MLLFLSSSSLSWTKSININLLSSHHSIQSSFSTFGLWILTNKQINKKNAIRFHFHHNRQLQSNNNNEGLILSRFHFHWMLKINSNARNKFKYNVFTFWWFLLLLLSFLFSVLGWISSWPMAFWKIYSFNVWAVIVKIIIIVVFFLFDHKNNDKKNLNWSWSMLNWPLLIYDSVVWSGVFFCNEMKVEN